MFEDVEVSIKVALYALTVLHLPKHSSQSWDKKFLLAFLTELKLPCKYYDTYYPLINKKSDEDKIIPETKVFMDIIDTAGSDLIELFIGLSIHMRFRSYFYLQPFASLLRTICMFYRLQCEQNFEFKSHLLCLIHECSKTREFRFHP